MWDIKNRSGIFGEACNARPLSKGWRKRQIRFAILDKKRGKAEGDMIMKFKCEAIERK